MAHWTAVSFRTWCVMPVGHEVNYRLQYSTFVQPIRRHQCNGLLSLTLRARDISELIANILNIYRKSRFDLFRIKECHCPWIVDLSECFWAVCMRFVRGIARETHYRCQVDEGHWLRLCCYLDDEPLPSSYSMRVADHYFLMIHFLMDFFGFCFQKSLLLFISVENCIFWCLWGFCCFCCWTDGTYHFSCCYNITNIRSGKHQFL